MKLIRHIGILFIALISIGLSSSIQAQNSQTSQTPVSTSILGMWNFETSTGTNTNNDVQTEIMSKGILKIVENGVGLTANVAWFDERGDVQSLRKMEGGLYNGRGTFTHTSTRTHVDPRGKETNTEVNIVWTLQAKDNVLSGSRLVAFGDDPAKPIFGTRSATLTMPTTVTSAAPVARGPSTPEERARVLLMAANGEVNPLAFQTTNATWLTQWVNDIPDITLRFGAVFDWLMRAANQDYREIGKFQFEAGAMAFQIKNPTQSEIQSAIDLAGAQSVLHAYEKLVSLNDKYRSVKMESALLASKKGELPNFLKKISGRE